MTVDSTAIQASLRALIEGWCDRRCLHALGHVLRPYLEFDGLRAGWTELRIGLAHARNFCGAELSQADWDSIHALMSAIDRAMDQL